MHDTKAITSPVGMIVPALYSADNTPPAVDLQGFDACTIIVSVGVGGITFSGTNKIEFVLTHSDDNSTYTNVVAADLLTDALAPTTITTGIVRSLVAAHAAATIQKIGYVGGKRYLKMLADFSGTHGAGTPIDVIAAKGYPTFAAVA